MRALPACLVALAATAAAWATLPSGFTETIVVSGMGDVRSFDWTPSADLWVATGQGKIWVSHGGAPILAAQIAVEHTNEHGLNSLVVDPDFATNHQIWLYYTTPSPVRNRLSRFTIVGDTLASETVILEGPLLSDTVHTGGCLRFATDGTLFLAMGEDAQGSVVAQNPFDLRGKILRIQRDGSPAPGNPYADGASGDARVWAIGFRNPFRCEIHPATGDLFVADVGAGAYEEIDIGLSGVNFGWANVEGPVPPGLPGYVYPIFSYDHSAPGAEAIIGGVHARPGDFAPEYEGDYFFADWALGKLWRMRLDATSAVTSVEVFSDQMQAAVELRFGADGALYYASLNGAIHRIAYVATGNRPPVAVGTASVDHGASPLQVTLDAAGSSDPDHDTITTQWDLGDGNVAQGAVVQHPYAAGVWKARATVTDPSGSFAQTSSIRIVSGNARPSATMSAPSAGAPYVAGQTITYQGTGTDPEDGTVPCSRFSWRVVRNYDGRSHAFQGPLQGACQGSFTTADRGASHPDETYDVLLGVEDSGAPLGSTAKLTGATSSRVQATTASVTLATQPLPDLDLALDGVVFTAPRTETTVVHFVRTVRALGPQLRPDGHSYRWVSWSDGGAREHEVRPPAGGATYVATFGCDVLDEVSRLRVDKGAGGSLSLSWDAMTDACLQSYQVYVAPSPADPAFALAGNTALNAFTRTPGPASEFYLVAGSGSDGRSGPVGHYGL